MKIFKLTRTQEINASLQEVFAFFEKPENLEKITPPQLNFKIITPSPIQMKQGALIDYLIKMHGLPLKWRTLITHYNPPHEFIDKQINGPYALWEHTHRFTEVGNKTRIEDEVLYALPFGILGQLAHALWVKRQLNQIFNHRQEVIKKFFTGETL